VNPQQINLTTFHLYNLYFIFIYVVQSMENISLDYLQSNMIHRRKWHLFDYLINDSNMRYNLRYTV